MKNTIKALSKQLFGAKYESARKSLLAAAILFIAIYAAEIRVAVAPAILYLTSTLFTAGVMWQVLTGRRQMEAMQGMLMLPFDHRGFVFGYVLVLGAHTLVTKTLLVWALFFASASWRIIPMSNDIISRVSAMYDIKIEDDHIADIIQGRPTILPQEVREVVFMKVRSYACDILDKLRELQVDLRANPAIFIGGGSILFRSFVEESPLVAHADFVTDPKANAIGYGMLATAQLRRMTPQNHGGEFFAQG